jgi:hypothetical protein
VKQVPVDVEELRAWCESHGLPLNASARAEFVAKKLPALESKKKH